MEKEDQDRVKFVKQQLLVIERRPVETNLGGSRSDELQSKPHQKFKQIEGIAQNQEKKFWQ